MRYLAVAALALLLAGTASSQSRFGVKAGLVLNYINTAFPDFNGRTCKAVWHHPDHSDSSHHLRLHVYNDASSDCIKLYFDLNCAVFSEQMSEIVPNHFLKLLDAFIENPQQSIGQASMLSEEEFQQIVVDFNQQKKSGEQKCS